MRVEEGEVCLFVVRRKAIVNCDLWEEKKKPIVCESREEEKKQRFVLFVLCVFFNFHFPSCALCLCI